MKLNKQLILEGVFDKSIEAEKKLEPKYEKKPNTINTYQLKKVSDTNSNPSFEPQQDEKAAEIVRNANSLSAMLMKSRLNETK